MRITAGAGSGSVGGYSLVLNLAQLVDAACTTSICSRTGSLAIGFSAFRIVSVIEDRCRLFSRDSIREPSTCHHLARTIRWWAPDPP